MEKEIFIQNISPLREKLLRYAYNFLKEESEAEDIVQEVFVKLWCMGKTLNEYDNKSALAYRVTKNLSLNRLKSKQYNEQGIDNISMTSNTIMPDNELEGKDDAAQVMNIITKLPEVQQAILRMRHIEGLEIQEIAAITGSKPESIRMNLSRGRKRVKELFFKIENYGTKI